MRKRRYYSISDFVCPECGMIIPLPRLQQREKGHIKDLYCPGCKTERKFVEYRRKDVYKTLDGTIVCA